MNTFCPVCNISFVASDIRISLSAIVCLHAACHKTLSYIEREELEQHWLDAEVQRDVIRKNQEVTT